MAAASSALSLTRNRVVLLRQKLASSGVDVRDTLKRCGLWGTGHERGSAGTVWRLCRGARRGDRACRSGGAVAGLLPGPAAAGGGQEGRGRRGGRGGGGGAGPA